VWGIPNAIKKINPELIVMADDAGAIVTELNAALDEPEEEHGNPLFGGGFETVENPAQRDP
jgi:hypothetical protein